MCRSKLYYFVEYSRLIIWAVMSNITYSWLKYKEIILPLNSVLSGHKDVVVCCLSRISFNFLPNWTEYIIQNVHRVRVHDSLHWDVWRDIMESSSPLRSSQNPLAPARGGNKVKGLYRGAGRRDSPTYLQIYTFCSSKAFVMWNNQYFSWLQEVCGGQQVPAVASVPGNDFIQISCPPRSRAQASRQL